MTQPVDGGASLTDTSVEGAEQGRIRLAVAAHVARLNLGQD